MYPAEIATRAPPISRRSQIRPRKTAEMIGLRDMSHDLMRTLLESLSAKLEQIIIHDIKDSTFFAKLVVRTNGEVQEIDARPSDGIALALRMRAALELALGWAEEVALDEGGHGSKSLTSRKSKWRNGSDAGGGLGREVRRQRAVGGDAGSDGGDLRVGRRNRPLMRDTAVRELAADRHRRGSSRDPASCRVHGRHRPG